MRRDLTAIAFAAIAAGAAGTTAAQPAPDPAAPAPEPPPPDPGAPATSPAGAAAPTGAGVATSASGPAAPLPIGDGRADVGDQAISVEAGAAIGGRVTPGGLRLVGQFIYQLSDEDWFDGGAAFTFGSGHPACFRDRSNKVICTHGVADGTGVELTASIRRMFTPRGSFQPFGRIGVGLGLARFGDDDISGFTIPAHFGAGVRVGIAPAAAIVAEGDLEFGFGSFSRGMGSQPQIGLAVAAGVEFRLR
jgi:opacity protein-like surface antigen